MDRACHIRGYGTLQYLYECWLFTLASITIKPSSVTLITYVSFFTTYPTTQHAFISFSFLTQMVWSSIIFVNCREYCVRVWSICPIMSLEMFLILFTTLGLYRVVSMPGWGRCFWTIFLTIITVGRCNDLKGRWKSV